MGKRVCLKSEYFGRLATAILLCMHGLMFMYYVAEVKLSQYRSVYVRQEVNYTAPFDDISKTRHETSYTMPFNDTYKTRQGTSYTSPITETRQKTSYNVPFKDSSKTRQETSHNVPFKETYKTRQETSHNVPFKDSSKTRQDTSYNVPFKDSSKTRQDTSYNVPFKDSSKTRQETSFNVPFKDTSKTRQETSFNVPFKDTSKTRQDTSYNVPFKDTFKTRQETSYNVPFKDSSKTRQETSYNVPFKDSSKTRQETSYNVPFKDSSKTRQETSYNVPFKDSSKTRQETSYNVPFNDTYKTKQKTRYAVPLKDTNKISDRKSNRSSTTWKTNEKCQKRLPGAIVAGIQKCGTAALMVFLNIHPQIAGVLNPKYSDGHAAMELKFFTQTYKKGLGWYRSNMPCSFSNQITIEKDPAYFYYPPSARRIKSMDSATKIIFIVKEPIERALSNHAMMSDSHDSLFPTFEEKVKLAGGGVDKKCGYLQHSSYANYIDPWIAQFGLNQILFVDGHKFEDEPVKELQKVERFLNIEPFFEERMFVFNETKGKPCYNSESDSSFCLGRTKGREHASISDNLRKSLQTYFKPLNELFFRKIKTRFSWGY